MNLMRLKALMLLCPFWIICDNGILFSQTSKAAQFPHQGKGTDIPGGSVSGIWNAPGSPYRVTADATIAAGQTLVVEAGVVVQLDPTVKLVVEGRLRVTGTLNSNVVFTASDTTGRWGGIQFRDSSNDDSFIVHAWIEYAEEGVYLDNSLARVDSTVFTRNGTGLWGETNMQTGGMNEFSGLEIYDNEVGFYAYWTFASHFRGCRFYNNGDAGVRGNSHVGSFDTIEFEKCLFYGNNIGIEFNGDRRQLHLKRSTVTNNVSTEIELIHSSSHSSGQAIIFESIVWGDLLEDGVVIVGQFSTDVSYSDVSLFEGVMPGTGNLNEGPRFVNPVQHDYSLASNSPCIDTGDPSSPLDSDGTRADMGALFFDQSIVVTDPSIHVEPAAHDFGSTLVGASLLRTFVVSNSGAGDLDVSSTTTVGVNAADFNIENGGGAFTLSRQETRDIVVNFSPTSVGEKQAALRFESNDLDRNPLEVNLSGTGSMVSGTQIPGGSVSGVWQLSGSPYQILGDVTIDAGKTLVVESGVRVELDANVKMIVEGRLRVQGTSGSRVVFTASDTSSRWGRIEFRDSSNDDSFIVHAWIEYAEEGVYLDNSLARVDSTVFTRNGTGLWGHSNMQTGGTSEFSGLEVYENDVGFYTYWTFESSFLNCRFYNNEDAGVRANDHVGSDDTVLFERCLLYGNNIGIEFNGDRRQLHLKRSTVTNNVSTEIELIHSSSHSSGQAIIFESIVWGDPLEDGVVIVGQFSTDVSYSDVSLFEGVIAGTGNLNEDPRFVNPAQHDYSLASNSPCIDAGDPSSPLDPDGTRADIGAFFFPQGNIAPEAPKNLIATAGDQQVMLTWSANPEQDFLRYRIYAGTSPNPTATVDSVDGKENTARSIIGLANGTAYYFRITAVDSGLLESDFSNEVSVTPRGSFTEIVNGDIVTDRGESRGSSWADYDKDGDLDMFVTNDDGENNFLYRNNGDGSFTTILSGSIVSDGGSSLGSSWGDYDNDGDLDLFVSNRNDEDNFFYENNGDDTFTKITAGILVNDGGYSQGCSWGDYDNDGNLDLFVANGDPQLVDMQPENFLYHNNGDGTFTKVASGPISEDREFSVGGSWVDYDSDGNLDLFVTNTFNEDNSLYRNDGDGAFVKINSGIIVNDGGNANGISWGDYDNDGDLDLFIADGGDENRLYQNNGNGTFTKLLDGIVVELRENSQGSSWGDFDNDGDLDLFVSNCCGTKNSLYQNDGDGTFTRIASGSIVNDGEDSRGGAWGDFTNDGHIDLFVTNCCGVNNLLYKNAGTANHWISLDLVGTLSNTAAIGAKVRVKAQINGSAVWQMRHISGQSGFYSQNPLRVEFGLGDASVIDSIRIEWPSGIEQVLTNIEVDQFLTIIEEAPNLAPASPTNLRAIAGDQQVTLIWDANIEPDFLRYRIYGGNSPNPTTAIDSVDGVSNSIKTISGLTNGEEYFLRVTAVDSSFLESSFSNEVHATPNQVFTRITLGAVVNDGGKSDGSSWGDYDNDGDLDLFVANDEGEKNFLYSNNGDGTFIKITDGSIVNDGGASQGSGWGDFDNDGDLDLFVGNTDLNDFLYSNNGNGTFTKIVSGSIVNNGGNAAGSSWGDYDNDGDLDLFVANFGQDNFLYANSGDGTFTQITNGDIVNDDGNSESCSWGDYDNDGDLDLFVANFGQDNFLYSNEGDGTFTRIMTGSIVNDGGSSVGCSWGDYDNDGDLDLFVANVNGQNNFLYNNNGNGTFTKITNGNIVSNSSDSEGGNWGDFDNYGDLDIFVTNINDQTNHLFQNNGDGTFTQLTAGQLVNDIGFSESSSWADYDQDGDIDLFVSNYDANNFFYENNGNSNNWINIRLVGTVSNTSAVGAKIRIKATIFDAPSWQLQELSGQTGFQSQNSLNAEFGLGNATLVDTIKIEWPSGIVQHLTDVAADQFLSITEELGGAPTISLDASAFDFDDVTVGDTASSVLQVRNVGSALLEVSNIELQGADSDQFSFNVIGSFTLDPNQSRNVTIEFTPTSEGEKSATLVIEHNAGGSPTVIDLNGRGVAEPVPLFQISNNTIDFGTVLVGQVLDDSLVISNDGSAELNVANVTTSGADASDYTLLSQASFNIAADDSASLMVRFTPGSEGSKSAVLNIFHNASGSPAAISMIGAGTAADIESPEVTAINAVATTDFGGSIDVSATVTDNVAVQEVRLLYREGGAATFQSVTMNADGTSYQGSIPSSVVATRGVEYTIEAVDAEGNVKREDVRAIQVRLAENQLQFGHEGGTAQTAYRLRSFPLATDNPSVNATLVDDLGAADSLQWRLWDIDPQRRDSLFPFREFPATTDMGPGNSKFLITLQTTTLTCEAGITVNTVTPFEIALTEGWNMIASPFNFDIPIVNVQPESLQTHLSSYNGTWTSGPTTLRPWEGYMIKVNERATLTILPSETSQQPVIAKSAPTPEWFVQIHANAESASDRDNVAGVIADAGPEWDRYERFEPPPIGEFVMVSFPHEAWQHYPDIHTTDYRPSSMEGHVWEFTVTTNIAEKAVTLDFMQLHSVPAEFEIKLVDVRLNLAQDLRANPQYIYRATRLGGQKSFQLLVGRSDFVEENIPEAANLPSTFELAQNFPNPFNPSTSIKFGLPEDSRIFLSIYNILGQEIVTLLNGVDRPAGFHVAIWDGRDQFGRAVSSGLYLYQLRAGKQVLTRKVTLIK